MSDRDATTRREFIRQVGAVAAAGTVAAAGERTAAQTAMAAKGRVIGANDRINVGFIGCGGRMNTHIRRVMERNKERGDVQAVAVNDIWDKRKQRAREATGVDETLGLPRLPRGLCEARHGRRGHRLTGSLAPRAGDGGAAQRQGRLPRKADDLHGRRGEGNRRGREGDRPRPAGRQPVHLDGPLLEGEEGHRRRADRRGDVGVRRLRAQPQPARRVELRDRPGRHRQDARLESLPRLRAEARIRSGALLPLAEILGLFRRDRHRPLLPLGVPAAADHRRRLPARASRRPAASTIRRTARSPTPSS